jgi:hypothetical protein
MTGHSVRLAQGAGESRIAKVAQMDCGLPEQQGFKPEEVECQPAQLANRQPLNEDQAEDREGQTIP